MRAITRSNPTRRERPRFKNHGSSQRKAQLRRIEKAYSDGTVVLLRRAGVPDCLALAVIA